MNPILLVIDVQNDFIDGSLGTAEAVSVLPNIVEKIKNFDGRVIFTKDLHHDNYMQTQEGKNLPVIHCIDGTHGWNMPDELEEYCERNDCDCFSKGIFGSLACAAYIKELYQKGEADEVTLIGYCTDICVVSNALILKSTMPELPLYVDASCCAGVTPEKHEAALKTMGSCQIKIING